MNCILRRLDPGDEFVSKKLWLPLVAQLNPLTKELNIKPPNAGAWFVVHGENDPVFPLDHGHAMATETPNAELLVLPDSGHLVLSPGWDLLAILLVHRCVTFLPSDQNRSEA